jgi:hypothetical protein
MVHLASEVEKRNKMALSFEMNSRSGILEADLGSGERRPPGISQNFMVHFNVYQIPKFHSQFKRFCMTLASMDSRLHFDMSLYPNSIVKVS